MSNETSEYMMLNFQMHLTFNFSPMLLVVQSCCFLFVGWRGNSSGFYMKIAFRFHPLTSKYFTTFRMGMKLRIIMMCMHIAVGYEFNYSQKSHRLHFSTKILFFSHQKSSFLSIHRGWCGTSRVHKINSWKLLPNLSLNVGRFA